MGKYEMNAMRKNRDYAIYGQMRPDREASWLDSFSALTLDFSPTPSSSYRSDGLFGDAVKIRQDADKVMKNAVLRHILSRSQNF